MCKVCESMLKIDEFSRGGENSGPQHQWSQKVFQVSRKNEKKENGFR